MLLTTGCFALMAIGVSVIALVSRNYSRQASRQTETLTDQFLPGLMTLARLQDAALNLKNINFQFALAKDDASMDEQTRAFAADLEQVARHVADLQRLARDAPTQQLIVAFVADLQSYRRASEKFQGALREGEFVKAMATLDQEIEPAQKKIETHLQALGEQYSRLARDASTQTTALLGQSDRFGFISTLVFAGFTLVCLALSLAATRALLEQEQKREVERQTAHATLERRVEERTADLRASEERIRLIVDTASDAIITTDADGIITAWNSQAENIFGWAGAAAVGRNLADAIITPTNRDALRQKLRQFIASGDGAALSGRVEITALHQDGHELPVEMVISPIRLGEVVLFSAFLHDITERKRAETELREVHRQLMDVSRHAGMAEVATGVLHNVGNVLNSVNVSATLVADTARRSKAGNLGKLSALLTEHQANLGAFLTADPRGQMIRPYLATLAEELSRERQSMVTELDHLRKNVDHIKDIVAMQQSYAKTSGVTETFSVPDLVEDAFRMNAGSLARHDVDIARDYQVRPVVTLDKHKVLQILVNLIRNAKYACDESGRNDKCITLRVTADQHHVMIAVSDNGVGIPAENLTRIFNHGFTTRATGHGFGLHSGALAAKEMGGSLLPHSDGPGRGATFILTLPFKLEPPHGNPAR